MKILVCGASGFLGRAICERLDSLGHTVVRGVRTPTRPGDIPIDFSSDITVAQWRDRLVGIEVVINAVGILTENATSRFEDIHHRAPVALFAACVAVGIQRVVHISALGAETGDTPYFRTKYAADKALMALPLTWQILRPALVYGTKGRSAALFCMLASLPIIPVPRLRDALFQPVDISDFTAAIERVIDLNTPGRQQIDVVGHSRVTYRSMLTHYRHAMRLPPAWVITIPSIFAHRAALLAAKIPNSPLTPATWRMLRAGSHGDPTPLTNLLQRPPKKIEDFISANDAELLRMRALSAWRTPLLRYTLALIWLASAYVSAFAHPAGASLKLLAAVGLHGWPATFALYGASLLDGAMGVACIKYPSRTLWMLQAGLVIVYSLIIAYALPEFLVHPFGPVLKNLAVLSILFILAAE